MAIIGITGTDNIGKTTFVNDFIKKWPQYKLATENTIDSIYIKEKKTTRKKFEEKENLELNIAIERLKGYDRKKDNAVFDGCILDNLIRVLWTKEKDDKLSDSFVWQIVEKVKNHLYLYDAVFYIPLSKKYPVKVEDKKIDLGKRLEMSHLFEGIIETYKTHKGSYFKLDDCPAILEVFGNPPERIAITGLYMEEINKPV